MVKLLCMSDTHFDKDAILKSKCDIFIHAGDFLGHGTIIEFVSFLSEMRSKLKYKYAILCPGNHDWICESDLTLCRGCLNKNEFLLTNDAITLLNVKFHACSWTKTFYNWAFMKSEKDLADVYAQIPENTDVVIAHGPPYGILDQNNWGEHCGSKSFLERMQIVKPQICCFGHIHQSFGVLDKDGTKFVNCSIMNDDYVVVNTPVVLEVHHEKRAGKKAVR